jgi:hypothetical protein
MKKKILLAVLTWIGLSFLADYLKKGWSQQGGYVTEQENQQEEEPEVVMPERIAITGRPPHPELN